MLTRTQHTHTHMPRHDTDLFPTLSDFDKEVRDAKVLKGLPVTNVLQFRVQRRQIEHGRMCLQNAPGNLKMSATKAQSEGGGAYV